MINPWFQCFCTQALFKPHSNLIQTSIKPCSQATHKATRGLSWLHAGSAGCMWAAHGPYADHTWTAVREPHLGRTWPTHRLYTQLSSPGLSWALPGSLGSILGHCSAICYSFGLFTLDSDKNKIWQRIWQLLSSDWLRDLSSQSHFSQKWFRWLLNRCSTVCFKDYKWKFEEILKLKHSWLYGYDSPPKLSYSTPSL